MIVWTKEKILTIIHNCYEVYCEEPKDKRTLEGFCGMLMNIVSMHFELETIYENNSQISKDNDKKH